MGQKQAKQNTATKYKNQPTNNPTNPKQNPNKTPTKQKQSIRKTKYYLQNNLVQFNSLVILKSVLSATSRKLPFTQHLLPIAFICYIPFMILPTWPNWHLIYAEFQAVRRSYETQSSQRPIAAGKKSPSASILQYYCGRLRKMKSYRCGVKLNFPSRRDKVLPGMCSYT